MDDSHRTLADYNIQKESTLHLVVCPDGLIVEIETMQGMLNVTINETTEKTIEAVKFEIQRKYEIHVHQQKLIFQGIELSNDSLSLA